MTNGISPKVLAVIAAVGGPGLVVLALGLILGDAELRAAGIALLVATTGAGAAGYKATPGDVVPSPAPTPAQIDVDAGDVAPL